MISGKIWDLPHTENCHILAIEFFLVTPLFENFSILNFQFQCPSSLLIDFSVWDFLSLTLSQYIKSLKFFVTIMFYRLNNDVAGL